MTNDELAEYYAGLLILQYLQKPKAFATVKALVSPIIMDQLPLAVQNAFGVGDASGVQLDIIGKYVGVSRNGYTLSGPVTLGDDDFRTLIKLVIIKNNAGSSLSEIQKLLAVNFPGQILVSDNQAMGLNYVLLETLGTSQLLEILTTGGYLPRPMGVQVSTVIVPEHTYPYFGYTRYTGSVAPFSPYNSYGFYQTTYPWLSYAGV